MSLHAEAKVVEPYVPPAPSADDPSTAGPLTLDQLLTHADAHAPSIRTARARAGLADADIVAVDVTAPSNPEFGLGVGARTVDGEAGVEFEASIAQQIEVGGQRGLRVNAARAARDTAEGTVNETRWAVHVEVHRIFAGLLLVRERLARAERFVAFSESLHNIATKQVEAGESSPLILLVAEADLAQTREALIGARQIEQSLRARMVAQVGWTGALPPIEGTLPPVVPAPEVPRLLALMAKHHPSLRTRELAVVAGIAQLEAAQRDGWPAPTLGLSYAREAAPGPEPEANVVLFNLAVPIPVWQSNQGGQARASAALHLADRERDQALVQLRSQVERAAAALDAAAQRVEVYSASVVPTIEQKLSLLERAYALGEVDVHQVSQTRERLLAATSRYLDARIEYYESAALLEGFIGTELRATMEAAP